MFFQQPPLISNPFSPFLSQLDVPTRHSLLNTCCIVSAYMQMMANAGLVILEPFLESEYYHGVTPRIRRAYVPHFPNVTASVAAFDKRMAVNAPGTMLCYKYAAKQMITGCIPKDLSSSYNPRTLKTRKCQRARVDRSC